MKMKKQRNRNQQAAARACKKIGNGPWVGPYASSTKNHRLAVARYLRAEFISSGKLVLGCLTQP